MAIKHKRKNSAGYTWSSGDLVEGQIGLNIADGTAHMRKADGTIVAIGGGVADTNTTYAISAETGTGGANLRLTGSDSSTDNVLIAEGTGITVTRTNANTITIDAGAGIVAETLRTMVYNAEATTITKGTPVYVYGAQGQQISVKKAVNTGESTSAQTLGLVEDDIASGAEGYVVTFGEVELMDTYAYNEGDPLYLGSTAGTLTTSKPYAPNHLVYIGFVEKKHAVSGRVFVKVQNGYELNELHDVNINHNTAIAGNQYLKYNNSNSLWENAALDISHDTSPTLGGNLALAGYNLSSTGDITITSNSGSGTVVIAGNLQVDGTTTTVNSTTVDIDDKNITLAKGAANAAAANGGGITLEGPTTSATLTYVDSDDSWNSNKLFKAIELSIDNININGNTIISSNTNGAINITPDGSGDLVLDGLKWPQADGTANYVLKTNGSGQLSWVAQTDQTKLINGSYEVALNTDGTVSFPQTSLGSYARIQSPSTTNFQINAGGGVFTLNYDGSLQMPYYKFPAADGTANYVLKTNGSGILSWVAQTVDTNTTYAISAETATGGVNLRLTGSDSSTDDVKFAAGTNITLTRTDANTITIDNSYTLDLTAPPAIGTVTPNAATFSTLTQDIGTGFTTSAWGSSGLLFKTVGRTILDNSSSGTVAAQYMNVIAAPTLQASNSTTYTESATLYISGAPTSSTNVTQTNSWALSTGGAVKFPRLYALRTGNQTAWTTGGAFSQFGTTAAAINDNTSSGTVAASYLNNFVAQAITSTNSTTYTDLANVYIGAPTVSGNLAATNIYALLTNGNIKAANITSTGRTTLKDIVETVYTGGSTTGTITPDVANGTVQSITLTGNITFNAFANPVSGQTLTLIITQSAGGSNTLTSTMKFAGGSKTLSTTGSAIDILTVSYIGTTYYASLVKGYA